MTLHILPYSNSNSYLLNELFHLATINLLLYVTNNRFLHDNYTTIHGGRVRNTYSLHNLQSLLHYLLCMCSVGSLLGHTM